MSKEKIEKAFSKLILFYPWWAAAGLQLIQKSDENLCSFMGTDGTHLFYNPRLLKKIDLKDTLFILCHEIMHCLLLHPYRRKQRNHVLWNIACDQAVNKILIESDIQTSLEKDLFISPDLNLTAEELYQKIKKNASMKEMFQDLQDADSNTGASTPKRTEADWKVTFQSLKGSMPATLKRNIEDLQETKIPWERLLAEFISRRIKSPDRTWSSRSRRMPMILPGNKRVPAPKIGIAVDTSGSIDNDMLSIFLAELKNLCSIYGLTRVFFTCDAEVHQTIEEDEEIPDHFIGGGGTDFRPVFKNLENYEIDALVYFTDGFGDYPHEVSLPVLWVLTKNGQQPPFGEVITL